jgi:hypothetical protein
MGSPLAAAVSLPGRRGPKRENSPPPSAGRGKPASSVLVTAQLVEVFPGEQAAVMPVVEVQPHGVVPDRLDLRDL